MVQMMKLVAIETAAVTKEVFDSYSPAQKRKYLAKHPNSKFGKKSTEKTPLQLKKEILARPNSTKAKEALRELNKRSKGKKHTYHSLLVEDQEKHAQGKKSIGKYWTPKPGAKSPRPIAS